MGSPSRRCLDSAPPTIELAVRFVARESDGLEAAVRAPGDRAAVETALRWHEDAHRPWLALLAACRRAGWSSAHQVGRLYAYHGCLAELLERGRPLSRDVGKVLADGLQRLTSDVIDDLRADAAYDARRHDGRPTAHVTATAAGSHPSPDE